MVTALLARDFLQQPENKGATIVYDLRSSHVVADEVKAAGGVPKRDRVGHAFIKKTMAETKAVFGGELSGHFYFRDNFFADSGAIAFARVLSVLSDQAEPLSDADRPAHSATARPARSTSRSRTRTPRSASWPTPTRRARSTTSTASPIDFGDWWFNVRKSNTEPMLRLNLEASNPRSMLEEKLKELQRLLGEPLHGH